jgi:hypothetical protein
MDQPGLAVTRPPLNCRETGLGFVLMKLAIFVILLFARSDSFFSAFCHQPADQTLMSAPVSAASLSAGWVAKNYLVILMWPNLIAVHKPPHFSRKILRIPDIVIISKIKLNIW